MNVCRGTSLLPLVIAIALFTAHPAPNAQAPAPSKAADFPIHDTTGSSPARIGAS